jgi:hypothetical protein
MQKLRPGLHNKLISLLTDESLSEMRMVNRPRTYLFEDSMITQESAAPGVIRMSALASELLEHEQVRHPGLAANQDQSDDKLYRAKMDTIIFDEKNNRLRAHQKPLPAPAKPEPRSSEDFKSKS